MNRRSFIKNTSISIGVGSITGISFCKQSSINSKSNESLTNLPEIINPSDEDFWDKIRTYYPRTPGIINLENGYFSHQAQPVLDFHQKLEAEINMKNSLFMRKEQDTRVEEIREKFARYQNCSAENVAFTRNTTESLNTIIMGFPWQKNDEVILGDQDYGSMVEAFTQAKNRWGIRLIVAKVPYQNHINIEEETTQSYLKLITPNTKMVHLTHPINLNGQGIPINKIISQIRKINPDICIVIDAAHALSHLSDSIGSLEADVIGSSLHKWTGNPLGLGCLYIKKEWIPNIWPLMGDVGKDINNIRRFEHQGTRPIQSIMTLEKAIEFNEKIGLQNRYYRLLYLKYIWQGNREGLANLSKLSGFKLTIPNQLREDHTKSNKITFLHPTNSFANQGAISTFSIEGKSPNQIADSLENEFNIFSVAINHPVIKGVRITPQLSNSIEDVLALNTAITAMIKNEKSN